MSMESTSRFLVVKSDAICDFSELASELLCGGVGEEQYLYFNLCVRRLYITMKLAVLRLFEGCRYGFEQSAIMAIFKAMGMITR